MEVDIVEVILEGKGATEQMTHFYTKPYINLDNIGATAYQKLVY